MYQPKCTTKQGTNALITN